MAEQAGRLCRRFGTYPGKDPLSGWRAVSSGRMGDSGIGGGRRENQGLLSGSKDSHQKKRVELLFSDIGEADYKFTKENEQLAYERYKAQMEDKVLLTFEEKIGYREFLKKLEQNIWDESLEDITIINHYDTFWKDFPNAYRHMNGYAVGRRGDDYTAAHCYLCKIPDFKELFETATLSMGAKLQHLEPEGTGKEFDEWFTVVLDWAESPRFTDYTRHIMYGALTRPAKREIEIFNPNQTVELFHEWMQKSSRIIDDWEDFIFKKITNDKTEADSGAAVLAMNAELEGGWEIFEAKSSEYTG